VPHIPRHFKLLSIVSACLLAGGGAAYIYFGYGVFVGNDIVVSQPPRIPVDGFFKDRSSLDSTSRDPSSPVAIGEPRSVKTIRVPGDVSSMPKTSYDPSTSESANPIGSFPPEFQLPSELFQTAAALSALAFANKESKKSTSPLEKNRKIKAK
jgi:hypothetical protein